MEQSPNKLVPIVILVLILAAAFGAYAYFSQMPEATNEQDTQMMASSTDTMTDDEKMSGDQAMMAAKGSYEVYSADKLSRAETGHVVLFFRATWCSTCKALDADIRAHLNSIPDGLSILDVNYDSSTALKQKYGVTTQHTLVEVDAQGTLIKKWTGSPTLAALSAEVI